MREIANGKVDGFPPKDELRTVYVEHDIDAEASDVSVAAYVLQDPTLQGEPAFLLIRVIHTCAFLVSAIETQQK